MPRKNSYDINNKQVHPNQEVKNNNEMQRTSSITSETGKTHASSGFKIRDIFKTEQDDSKVKEKPGGLVSLLSLFRFANTMDIVYMVIGGVASLANGAAFPLMLLIFGNLTDTFTGRSFDLCTFNFTLLQPFCPNDTILNSQNALNILPKCNFTGTNFSIPTNDFTAKIREQALWLVVIGCATIVVGYFQVAFWSIPCERQTRRLREVIFRSILNKEIAYFDTNKTGELNTRLTEDVNKVHDGTGDKIGSALQFVSAFFTGVILGFIKGWKLTLVILSVSPILFVSAVIFTSLTAKMTSQELKAYAKAGAVAEEVFSSIRTVFAYNGAAYESKRYERHLRSAKIHGIRKGAINGALMGLIWMIIFCVYALGFWYGAKLVREEKFSIGGILIVFFSIITAVFSLGQAAPHLQSVAQARGAAFTLWSIIDTPSKIRSDSEEGIKMKEFIGDVQFSDVHFVYPSRPDVPVHNGLSFTAQRGETTALVGTSGCGKSTCMQLLQRFYDPINGSVEIDGHQVSQYNLGWL